MVQTNADPVVAKTYLSGFIEKFPLWQAALTEAGIRSDAMYLRHEAKLPPRCRAALGYYRMVALAGGPDQDNPVTIARAAPPWLQSRTLADENLAVRACNTLASAGIRTIGDLSRAVTISQVHGLGQIGVQDVTALMRSLLILEKNDNEQRYLDLCGYDTVMESPSFWAAIDMGLSHSYMRESNILRKRLALDGERWTLQDTADLFNVTRERVRQIEAAALRRIAANQNWSRFIIGKLTALLAHRAAPVSLADVVRLDPWFEGLASKVTAIPLVLEYLLQCNIRMLTIGETHYLGYLSTEAWPSIRTAAIKRLTDLESREGADLLDDAACCAIAGAVLPDNAKEFTDLLWQDIKSAFQFGIDESGREVMLVAGTSMSAKVLAILEQARTPLHFSDIARQIEDRTGQSVEVRVVHNVTAVVGILLGQGMYGLEKHLPYEPAARARILRVCETIVEDGPKGRSWHIEEILSALLRKQSATLVDLDLSILTNYTLNIIMKKTETLLDLGRFVWQIKPPVFETEPTQPCTNETAGRDESGQENRPVSSPATASHAKAVRGMAGRGKLNDLIIEILEKAGHPLHNQELRDRVRQQRGTRDEMLIHQSDVIIRVGPKLWGINDRDTPLKREDQPALIEQVHEQMARTRKGVKLSEICGMFEVPPGCTPEIVFSIVLNDPRFRVGPGRYLMLNAWDGPGRFTTLQAVQQVLSRASKPLGLDKINDLVNDLMDEVVPRRSISTVLRAAGGELLDNGRWRDGKRGASGQKRPVRGSSSPATGKVGS